MKNFLLFEVLLLVLLYIGFAVLYASFDPACWEEREMFVTILYCGTILNLFFNILSE